MADNELRELFSKNLRSWLDERGKTQADLRRYMNVSSATASDWCNGRKIPRTDKIQSICTWLGVELNDLLTDQNGQDPEPPAYYLNPETAAIAQEVFENPHIRVLFDAARDCKPEDIKMAADLLMRLKETNR